MFIQIILRNLLAALAIGLLYTLLFRQWTAGLNVLLFDLAVLGGVAAFRPEARRGAPTQFAGAALLFSSICVVLVHSWLASFTHLLCFWIFLGAVQAREVRFIWYSLLLGSIGILGSWARALGYGRMLRPGGNGSSGSWRWLGYWLRLVVLPAGLIGLFCWLYFWGNAAFAERVSALGEWLSTRGLPRVDWATVLLCAIGTTLGLALLLPLRYEPVMFRHLVNRREELLRRRRPRPRYPTAGPLALLREYRMGLISLGFLNVLLSFVNALDLRYVWLDSRSPSAAELSAYVHEGTTSLTASIFLAMVVVVVFFRGNLNFLPRSRPLYVLTYLWLAQNALLAVSVAVRNGRYIAAYGLAEGRIIVAFFLLLVFLGLATLYRKIRYRKTLAYLLQRNALNLLATLLIFSALNWNVLITRYNLNVPTRAGIDWSYLDYGLSGDDNLFLLVRDDRAPNQADFRRRLVAARQRFHQRHWTGWNWPGYRNGRGGGS